MKMHMDDGRTVRLKLIRDEDDGSITLVGGVVDSENDIDFKYYFLSFYPDGHVERHSGIGEDVGFEVTKAGYVKLLKD